MTPLLREGTYYIRLGTISVDTRPTKFEGVRAVDITFYLRGSKQHKSLLATEETIKTIMAKWIEGSWAYAKIHHVEHDGHTWARFEIVG